MLTEICQYLRNWFTRDIWTGTWTISGGVLTDEDGAAPSLLSGQYYRIIGSVLNDGVHKYGDEQDQLSDEAFEGAVWSMAMPPVLVALAAEIDDWVAQYGGADSAAMSPYQSESIPNYSYSMKTGGSSPGTGGAAFVSWQDVFGARLSPWRKI